MPSNSSPSASIDIEGVSIAYGSADPVVRDVSVHVPAGSITALLGPSGCGKTTLLRAIAGLEAPLDGTVTLGDRMVSGGGVWVPPQRRNVGMVFQDPALFPHLSVANNIAFGLRQMPRAAREDRVAEMLQLIGLRDFATRLPATLSGGQQQRVALARSLAPRPAVLLLDEPFSALDAQLRAQIRTDVAEIVRRVGVTAVFVTHDQDEAFVIGDTVGVMQDGRMRQLGTPDDLYTAPADRWVAEFVGEANVLRGAAADGHATTALGRLPLQHRSASGEVAVLVRPEAVRLGGDGQPGRIERLDFFGHDTRVAVRLADQTLVLARVRSRAGLERGATTNVGYDGGPAMAWSWD